MRSSRLLSILMLLQLRGRVTGKALAAEFEVSLRTIYRDIDQLSAPASRSTRTVGRAAASPCWTATARG